MMVTDRLGENGREEEEEEERENACGGRRRGAGGRVEGRSYEC